MGTAMGTAPARPAVPSSPALISSSAGRVRCGTCTCPPRVAVVAASAALTDASSADLELSSASRLAMRANALELSPSRRSPGDLPRGALVGYERRRTARQGAAGAAGGAGGAEGPSWGLRHSAGLGSGSAPWEMRRASDELSAHTSHCGTRRRAPGGRFWPGERHWSDHWRVSRRCDGR